MNAFEVAVKEAAQRIYVPEDALPSLALGQQAAFEAGARWAAAYHAAVGEGHPAPVGDAS